MRLAALILVVACGTAIAQRLPLAPPGWLLVGGVKAGCREFSAMSQVLPDLKVDPGQVLVNVRAEAPGLECGTRPEYLLYTDKQNYYLVLSARVPRTADRLDSGFVVDGSTGKVVNLGAKGK